MGLSVGILGLRRRLTGCSFVFSPSRKAFVSKDRSFSFVPLCPVVVDCDGSASLFFCPAAIDSFSFAAGNSWYFRGSVGWCILHTYFSDSSMQALSFVCVIFSERVRRMCWPNILLVMLHWENVVIALWLYNYSTPSYLVVPPVNPQYEPWTFHRLPPAGPALSTTGSPQK